VAAVAVVQGIRVSKGTAADMTAHLAELRYGRDAVMALEGHPVVDLFNGLSDELLLYAGDNFDYYILGFHTVGFEVRYEQQLNLVPNDISRTEQELHIAYCSLCSRHLGFYRPNSCLCYVAPYHLLTDRIVVFYTNITCLTCNSKP